MFSYVQVLSPEKKIAPLGKAAPFDEAGEYDIIVVTGIEAVLSAFLIEKGLEPMISGLFFNRPGVNNLGQFLSDQEVKNKIDDQVQRGRELFVGPAAHLVDGELVVFSSDAVSEGFGLWAHDGPLQSEDAESIVAFSLEITRSRLAEETGKSIRFSKEVN